MKTVAVSPTPCRIFFFFLRCRHSGNIGSLIFRCRPYQNISSAAKLLWQKYSAKRREGGLENEKTKAMKAMRGRKKWPKVNGGWPREAVAEIIVRSKQHYCVWRCFAKRCGSCLAFLQIAQLYVTSLAAAE